ncbi:hypothetical protein [Stutzerimonas stutzeri]|nr:hypothetical protein [Stutzerimonas stutzeri]
MGGHMGLFPYDPESGIGGCLSHAPEQQSGIGENPWRAAHRPA